VKSLDALRVELTGTNLVEASAGTGKTHTITTIYPRLLLELRLSVNQILVVTYTNAATAELRSRMRQRLRSMLDTLETGTSSGDDVIDALIQSRREAGTAREDRHRLLEAVRSFDDAAIFTIHGFCQRMLQENAFESGVPFDATLLSDESLLRNEVVRDFWTRELHAASELFVRHLQGKKVTPADLSLVASRVVTDPLMPVLPETLEGDFSAAEEKWREAHAVTASLWHRHGKELIDLLAGSSALNRNSYQPETIRKRWWVSMEDLFHTPVPGVTKRFPAFEKWTNAGLAHAVKRGKTAPKHAFFDACDRLLAADREILAALDRRTVRLWLDMTAYAREEFRARKAASRTLSFDDLLHYLRAALAAPEGQALAALIRARFGAALIDEFQDTDPVQYEIFRRIYHGSGAPLFLIGDPKQAIYAFRGADVFAYIAARSDAGSRAHTLKVNRRSDPGLLKGINTLFHGARRQFVIAGIPFACMEAAPSSGDRLHATAAYRAPLEILFVPRTGQEARGDRINKGWGTKGLTRLVAGEVASFLCSGATIDQREVVPEDVALLCRTNAQAVAMQRELRELSVPCVLLGEASVFESPEAADVDRVLRALAEPGNSRALRAALATPLLGLDASALRGLSEDEERWEEWVQRFHAWHEIWQRVGFLPAFRRMLAECEVQSRLLGLVDGERRVTNILHLGELIEAAAQEVRRGPFALARWLTLMRTDRAARGALGTEAAQIRLESDDNAVRVVTIHKSKGLQYPVVYCPYLWDGTLLRDEDCKWVRFHDPADRNRRKLDVGSPDIEAHRRRAELEAMAENVRLLYVALTRARHRCTVVWGAFRDAERSPLGYLLHQPGAGVDEGDLVAETEKRLASLSDADMLAVAVREISPVRAAPYPVPRREARPLARRRFERALPTHWRVSSFSALTSEVEISPYAVEAEESDHDEALDNSAGTEPAALAHAATDTMPLLDFPPGARAGQLLHEIFERIDFRRENPDELPQVVADALVSYSFEPRWQEPICQAVDAVLATPLDETCDAPILARVPRSRRISELEFLLPVGEAGGSEGEALTGPQMADVFARHATQPTGAAYADRLRRLAFASLAGYLRGFIDLVFEDRGRWYLVDYKSNLLGATAADYEPARLLESMLHHHYFLQYHLYVLALHRHLGARLADYDYERDFGGVYYLFLRGMSPAHPPGCAVFRDRPRRALIEALSRLISRPGGGT